MAQEGGHPRSRGFTLIELLVVVAIIAILAAIALPNFLEAQTRAKVSRARADIRALVTAIETYRVDWNAYPTYHYADANNSFLEFHIGGKVPSWGTPDPDWQGANPITTPTAYMTAMPEDPFAAQRLAEPREVREYLYVNWNYAIQQVGWPTFQETLQAYGPYRIHSRGPDLDGPDSGGPLRPDQRRPQRRRHHLRPEPRLRPLHALRLARPVGVLMARSESLMRWRWHPCRP
jgi:prepilin-type N-terminal cleavage/methylation domain-containing protein